MRVLHWKPDLLVPSKRIADASLHIDKLGKGQDVGNSLCGRHGKFSAIGGQGLRSSLERPEQRWLMQKNDQGMEPAMEEEKVSALVKLDVLLEVDRIKVQLGRQVLVDACQPIFPSSELLLQVSSNVSGASYPVEEIGNTAV